MGKEKAGPLTPKAIANRIKAKGLQKLRWYCQMCQKQCRDENGFKCHTMSESHQRQLLLFADNPDQYIDSFSKEFEEGFLTLVKRSFGTRRVHANQVYQEYISDRNHLHMNATQWETLTEFVKWLGREGKCKVDQTEKGWFITYIDRDPETIERQKAMEAKEKMDLDDQEKTAKFIEKQIERERVRKGDQPKAVYTELKRDDEEEKVTFSLGGSKKNEGAAGTSEKSTSADASSSSAKAQNVLDSRPFKIKISEKDGESSAVKEKVKQKEKDRKRKSALDEIMEMEEIKKQKVSRKDYWLAKGIIVKVVHKKCGEKYYKKKGVVKEVQNRFVGIVKMLDSGDVLKIDQEHLETVIPSLGKSVLVVNGMHRGTAATLVALDEKSFSVTVKLEEGPNRGKTVEKVAYEAISKLSC